MTPEELTEAREALGLKQIELARLFETTDRTVRAWESGEPRWRIPFAVAMLIKLAVKYAAVRRELGIRPKLARSQRVTDDQTPSAESEQTPPG